MERLHRTLVAMLILLSFFHIASTVNAVEVSFAVKPSVAEPGEDVNIDVELVNKANGSLGSNIGDADNVEINYLDSYPLRLKRKSQSITDPFRLCFSCTKKGTFYFSVDPDANSNVYPIFFEVKEGAFTFNKELSIEVKGFPNLVFDTTIDKETLKPGDIFNMSLKLTNVGSGAAKKIKISQESTNFIMQGDNLIFVDELPIKQSKNVSLTFLVNEDVKPGTYLLPIIISNEDTRRNLFNFTQKIGLSILNKAKINIRNLKVARDDGLLDIRLRVENVGKGEANDITAELNTKYQGFKKNYIGKLDTDEDLPIIFTLHMKNSGKQTIPLIVKYNDDFGNYTLVENLEFEAKNKFGVLTFLYILLPVVVFISVLIFFQMRRRHRNSEV
ncbi:MAG: COG1361 S-layer family protein [Nanoarchaeota archaeon]